MNCQWLYSGEALDNLIPDPGVRQEAQAALMGLIDEDSLLPAGCIEPFESILRLPAGSAIALYKSLIITGTITPDMNKKLFP